MGGRGIGRAVGGRGWGGGGGGGRRGGGEWEAERRGRKRSMLLLFLVQFKLHNYVKNKECFSCQL